jgi:hypothetical protein
MFGNVQMPSQILPNVQLMQQQIAQTLQFHRFA